MYYAQGFSYLSDDPAACANCHIMREHYDGWQKARQPVLAKIPGENRCCDPSPAVLDDDARRVRAHPVGFELRRTPALRHPNADACAGTATAPAIRRSAPATSRMSLPR